MSELKHRSLNILFLVGTVAAILAGLTFANTKNAGEPRPGDQTSPINRDDYAVAEIPYSGKDDRQTDYNIENRVSGVAGLRNPKDKDRSDWKDISADEADLTITIWFFKYMAFVCFLCSSLTSAVVFRFVSENLASDEQVTKFTNAVGWALQLPVLKLLLGGFCLFLHTIMMQWNNANFAEDQTGGRVIGMIFAAFVLIAFLGVTFVLEKGAGTAQFRAK